MRILFIGSHIDDITLSCGATISRFIQEGHELTCVTLSHVYEGVDLSHEFIADMQTLGVPAYPILNFETRHFERDRQKILDYLFTLNDYDMVFTHSANDFHADHSTVGRESLRAFKHTNLITYTGSWNTRHQVKNYFVKVAISNCMKKEEALLHYGSQQHRPYMQGLFMWSELHVNGLMCNSEYAEAFEVVNYIL